MRTKNPKTADRILKAAVELFRENGFATTSMDAIAAGAGVSKATVYSHFENKEELFRQMVSVFVESVLTIMPPAEAVEDVRAELLAFAQRIYQKMPEKAEWDRMIFAATRRFPKLAQIYYEMGPARGKAQLAEFLRANSEAGKLRVDDAQFSAEMFFGMVFGTKLYHTLLFCAAAEIEPDHSERLVDAFLKVHQA